jgi:hypothetical protein
MKMININNSLKLAQTRNSNNTVVVSCSPSHSGPSCSHSGFGSSPIPSSGTIS